LVPIDIVGIGRCCVPIAEEALDLGIEIPNLLCDIRLGNLRRALCLGLDFLE
jgi:hypothetical protein